MLTRLQAYTRAHEDPGIIVQLMAAAGIEPSPRVYQYRIEHCLKTHNLEYALHLLGELRDRGLEPTLETEEALLLLAARQQEHALAMDLLRRYESGSVRMFRPELLAEVLLLVADTHDVRPRR